MENDEKWGEVKECVIYVILYCAPDEFAVQPDCRPPARYFPGGIIVNPGGLQYKSAYHCYDVAVNLMKLYQHDEMYLNDVAYHLQQCVEKTLKAFLECRGVTVPQTHSIRKLISMSANNGSVAVVTDWLAENQYEIETWESDTRYNFDICLEAGRIRTGLEEVRRFLDINHMGYELNPELTEERKARLREKLPRNLVIRDDFEWNCYYNIFKKGLK